MKYRRLGTSNLRVSEISFGCMSLKPDATNTDELINLAIHKGINFFDTADLYDFGLNEELVAKAIHGKRQDLIIATKVGNQWTKGKDGWNWNPTKSYILQAVEQSLRRLNTDYIDLYQLHGGTLDDPIDETIEAFEILKNQGKIREYGISSIRPNVIREYAKRANIVSVMMQYSLLDRRPEEECLERLKDARISVITRGTLAKGLLIDKPPKAYLGYSAEEVATIQADIQSNSEKYGINPLLAATKFVLANEPVAAAIIGFRTEEQVNNSLDGFDDTELTAKQLSILKGLTAPHQYSSHR